MQGSVAAMTVAPLAGFVAAYLAAGRLGGDGAAARSALSFASGVAVAYVLLLVLPELERHHDGIGGSLPRLPVSQLWREPYLVALGGLVAFYLLERWLRDEWVPSKAAGEPCVPEGPGFWAHLAVFALYTGFFAHQLHRYAESGAIETGLHGTALTLHFLTAGNALRRDYGARYQRVARWALGLAACIGWLAGFAFRIPAVAAAVLFAFLAGGILLNVLKEELPGERGSRMLPLLLGALGYAGLVVAAGRL